MEMLMERDGNGKLSTDPRRALDCYGFYIVGTTLNIHCTLMNILFL